MQHTISGTSPFDAIMRQKKPDVIDRLSETIADLCKIFKIMCHDFAEPLCDEKPSKAIEFCEKMIYDVELRGTFLQDDPLIAREVFKFNYGDDVKTVLVNPIRDICKAVVYTVNGENNRMRISLGSASYLAMITFIQLTEKAYYSIHKVYMLTPLASRLLPLNHISGLSEALGVSKLQLLQMINTSCSPAGYAFSDSQMYIAAVAAVATTEREDFRERKIGEEMGKYLLQGKTMDHAKYSIFIKYISFKIPAKYTSDSLLTLGMQYGNQQYGTQRFKY